VQQSRAKLGKMTKSFPPPWTVKELEACFFVSDSTGQKLAYVYFEDEPGRRSAAKLLTHDEARRIAENIAKLPNLLQKPASEMIRPSDDDGPKPKMSVT
jgi:hypothetical protein